MSKQKEKKFLYYFINVLLAQNKINIEDFFFHWRLTCAK